MKNERKLSGLFATIIIAGLLCLVSLQSIVFPVRAATEEEIEQAIENGIAWLITQQNPTTGAWQDVPRTGFVLIKLQDRAYELGLDPFETDPEQPDYYEYAQNVIDGWEYLFTPSGANSGVYAYKQTIGLQDHTGGASGTNDDPDTRVNGYGITFGGSVYNTGICLMAIAASGAPDRVNDGGIDYDGDSNSDTFEEIAQDMVDWLAFAQTDLNNAAEGGWYYSARDNGGTDADNSNSGYAVLGLAAAEGFGCTVPSWVKTELNDWIDWVQNDANGGSAYSVGWGTDYWINQLKTGNLIFEMTFVGDLPSDSRFVNALNYIETHWHDENYDPGWGYNQGSPAHYQAIYCLMKGLEYSGIHLIDLDGDDTPEHDWYEEFADVIVSQQNPSGSWPSSPAYVWPYGAWGTMSGEILSTVWVLLTLEKITPPPPIQFEVEKDFRYTNVNFNPYHWEDPDGVPGSGDEYIVYDPANLGALLPQDEDGNYLVDVVLKPKKNIVSSTNPGQLYGVITITGPVEECTISDDFGMEFDVNPAKLGGGIEIIMVDTDGYATILTYESGISATVDNSANHVEISIELDEPLETGYLLMIYIKFQTSMKDQTYPDPSVPYDEWFGNSAEIHINENDEPFTAEAMIKLSIK